MSLVVVGGISISVIFHCIIYTCMSKHSTIVLHSKCLWGVTPTLSWMTSKIQTREVSDDALTFLAFSYEVSVDIVVFKWFGQYSST